MVINHYQTSLKQVYQKYSLSILWKQTIHKVVIFSFFLIVGKISRPHSVSKLDIINSVNLRMWNYRLFSNKRVKQYLLYFRAWAITFIVIAVLVVLGIIIATVLCCCGLCNAVVSCCCKPKRKEYVVIRDEPNVPAAGYSTTTVYPVYTGAPSPPAYQPPQADAAKQPPLKPV